MRQYLTSIMGEGQEYQVYDYLIRRLGQLAQTSDGRTFRLVRFVGNATAGQVVSEDMSIQNLKSAKVVASRGSQYLEITFENVAANTVLFEKDTIQLFRDDTSLGGRLYRVQTNPDVFNDSNQVADVTVQITVVDSSNNDDDGGTIPSDYNQGTKDKAVVYATQYLDGSVIDYSVAAAAGKSRRVLGVAATKVTASAASPQYAFVQVAGPCLVSKDGSACDSGRPIQMAVAAGDGGQTSPVDDATDVVRYPVGIVRVAALAGDSFVFADINIQS